MSTTETMKVAGGNVVHGDQIEHVAASICKSLGQEPYDHVDARTIGAEKAREIGLPEEYYVYHPPIKIVAWTLYVREAKIALAAHYAIQNPPGFW